LSSLTRFLDQLDGQLKKALPKTEAEAIVEEARNHLEDSIQARLELGATAEEAETQALLAFGSSQPLVRGWSNVTAPSVAPRLYLMGVGYLLAGVFILTAHLLYDRFRDPAFGFFCVFGAIAVGFVGCSFRSRRPAPGPVFATGLGGTLVLWILLGSTWMTLAPYGGMGVVPPGFADRQLAECERLLVQRSADRTVVDTAMTVLRSPIGIEGLRSGVGYVAPVTKAQWAYSEPFKLTTLRDPMEARDAWEDLNRRGRWRFETSELVSSVAAIKAARTDSTWQSVLNAAPSIIPGGLAIALGTALTDMAFGGLGALFLRLGRRRPPGGVHV
jgi:hypothetical protein